MDFLNLPNWHVVACDEGEDRYVIVGMPSSPGRLCPQCGSTSLVKHGNDRQRFIDLPCHGKWVYLEAEHQRFRCTACRKTCYQLLPDIDTKRCMTERLVAYIERKTLSTNRTFISIAEETGVDPGTVRAVFDDAVRRFDHRLAFTAPTMLGIDELHILGAPRGVITNLSEHTIIELLEDRKQESIARALRRIHPTERVKTVVTDLWNPYKLAVRAVFPDATLVCDKFHVLKLATTALESFRKEISTSLKESQRKTLKMHDRFLLLRRRHDLTPEQEFLLESWITTLPLLGQAYELKEEFFSIYDHQTHNQAITAYFRWMEHVPKELRHIYQPLMLTIEEWGDPIFAHFDQDHITGGFVESENNIARCLNRIGRGYSLPVLRARLL